MRCKPRNIYRSDFEGGLGEVVLLFLFRELYEPTSPDKRRLHDISFRTPFPGGRPSNLNLKAEVKVAHLLFQNFVLVQRSRAAAFSRYEAGLMVYFMTKNLALIVDLWLRRDRENVCVCVCV